MSEKNSAGITLAFILGGLIGAALGVLYAPSSGKETRKRIKNMTGDLIDNAGDFVENVKEKTINAVEDAKEKLNSKKERLEFAFEAGKKAYKEGKIEE
ncbi:MAG: YtxH domain-containing protein [Endomicrobiales bacterium]|nr:YtxH domain-containing protein [Endomicrobiales bacterium]